MNLYVHKTVKCEVINVQFLSKDLHTVHWGIIPTPLKKYQPLFSTKPSLNLKSVQAPPFSGDFPIYIAFP